HRDFGRATWARLTPVYPSCAARVLVEVRPLLRQSCIHSNVAAVGISVPASTSMVVEARVAAAGL
ncbi:unnamed protein product, partial [Pylaiella littoralis]